MKTNIMLALLCSVLISCASLSSNEHAEVPAPAIDTSIASDLTVPVNPESTVGMGDIPAEPTFNDAATATGVEQITVNEPAPELKPVHPATAWVPPAPVAEPVAAAPVKKVVKKSSAGIAKSAKSLKAAKAAKAKKAALAKKGKNGKAVAKKPTKAECKKFAKNSKKHKKELAVCKLEKKKATAKLKKSRKVVRS